MFLGHHRCGSRILSWGNCSALNEMVALCPRYRTVSLWKEMPASGMVPSMRHLTSLLWEDSGLRTSTEMNSSLSEYPSPLRSERMKGALRRTSPVGYTLTLFQMPVFLSLIPSSKVKSHPAVISWVTPSPILPSPPLWFSPGAPQLFWRKVPGESTGKTLRASAFFSPMRASRVMSMSNSLNIPECTPSRRPLNQISAR